ncbi:pyranose dehydrogenase 3 [Chaetomidium leptoderma]|uniref:Pyranose dehydrogenase 3 n=1 Tax=Chaetomidium leptoderma TaxID=669021 RepID=A0AAN7A0C2_9PEZI|nr:pyranose dehydrogenase 3 [Chaetomidium leptoderma]
MLGSILLSLLLTVTVAVAQESQRPPKPREYDYIIVGGGTAGNALATRLSQGLKRASILVIEAGPSALHEDRINVPGLKGSTLGGKYDWNFTTIPQPHLKNRTIFTPRGRVLGGTSALNLLTWGPRGSGRIRQLGSPMEKAETYVGGPPGSGASGPIDAVINRMLPTHQKSFIPTVSQHFPIPFNPDSLQGNPIGVMYHPENINPTSYNRSYSANAYLPLAGPNLAILTNTQVTKTNFRPLDKKPHLHLATGVTLADGTTLTARHQVLLCAGAIGTPQLLELSGIGGRRHVVVVGQQQQQQPLVVVDLPGVGENYQDHLRVQVSYRLRDDVGFGPGGDALNTNVTFAAEEWAKRKRGEAGFYDDTGGVYVFADWKRVVAGGDDGGLVRLAKGVVVGGKGGGGGGSRDDVGLRKKLEMLGDETVPQVEIIYSDGYTGRAHQPADPLGKPVIDPRFLDNEYDMAGVVEILKFCRRIARSEPLRSGWVEEYEPGEALVQTDEDWREYVRSTTLTVFHPMGTAAMLPRKDGGVVDPKLIVYGTANLRVVDASIIPVQISAHPQTAVYGIAERAAEMIIAAHR